jgi:hypothetical protein
VRKCTMHELSVQVHKLSISHRAQAHELLIMAATTTYVDDEILRVSAQGIHITSRNGDDNNNGNDDNECRQRSLVPKCMAFSYCDMRLQQQSATMMTNVDDKVACTSAQH